MELWIVIAIGAAFLQNLRSMVQKLLRSRLSVWGATSSRFVFAAPLAIVAVFIISQVTGQSIPAPNAIFAAYATVGSVAQILGTVLLVYLFSLRNFAIGKVFTNTETVQTAIFGIVVLGDFISFWSAIGIVISLVGVVLMSATKIEGRFGRLRSLLDRTALIGLASGAMFGISAVSYRGASLSLDSGDFLVRAATTLALVTTFQAFIMVVYLTWREKGELQRLIAASPIAFWAGASGMLASLGWFSAMTLEPAAMVRAVGQIEILFTFMAALLFFKEKISLREFTGIFCVTIGILVLVIFG